MLLKSAIIRPWKGDPYFSTGRGRRDRICKNHRVGSTAAVHRRTCTSGGHTAPSAHNMVCRKPTHSKLRRDEQS
jgi:hypothetical protein